MNKEIVLSLKGISKSYRQGEKELEILKEVNFQVSSGEVVGIVAPSGTGKSTLLHIAGLLEKASQGEVEIIGRPVNTSSDNLMSSFRRQYIGFVYQFHHLLPEFTALENVMLPQLIAGQKKKMAENRALELLEGLGLSPRVAHRPSELSGGEQQRVAIARALANKPRLLLADEPTGNLDDGTSQEVFQQLLNLTRSNHMGALIATHNQELAQKMDRIITLKHGQVVNY